MKIERSSSYDRSKHSNKIMAAGRFSICRTGEVCRSFIVMGGAEMPSSHFVAVRRLSCIVLMAATVSACSTAEYGAPIKEFSDATDKATEAVNELNQSLAKATLDYAVAAAARDPANNHLEVPEDDCRTLDTNENAKVRCQAVIKLKSTLGPEATVARGDYTNPLGNMVGLMGAIKDYANNLAAVQSDNTVAEVNDSVDKIQASLVKLMQTADPESKDKPSTLPKAAGEAVKWAFGQYIESVKYRALRDATAAAREPLALAEGVFRDVDTSVKLQLSGPASIRARDSRRNMDPKDESSIRSALAAQNAYDDMLTAPMSDMFSKLVAAHADLADALDGSKPLSVRDALAKLKDVQTQAEALGKIAKDLSAALKEEESPSS